MDESLECSTWLPARIEDVFAFHLDPANIPLISPPSLRLLHLDKPPVPKVGAHIHLLVRQFGWTQKWEVVWDIIDPPSGQPACARLVDRALRSPFAAWRHEHLFQQDGCGCFMTDRILYRLPLDPWSRPAKPLARLALHQMFEDRHRRTVHYFNNRPFARGLPPPLAQEKTDRSELPKSPST